GQGLLETPLPLPGAEAVDGAVPRRRDQPGDRAPAPRVVELRLVPHRVHHLLEDLLRVVRIPEDPENDRIDLVAVTLVTLPEGVFASGGDGLEQGFVGGREERVHYKNIL